jgi:zinc protease
MATLKKAFGAWPRGAPAVAPEIPLASAPPGVYFVVKDDVTSSTVQLVEPGTTRQSPDYYAIEVFNQFFGGSFSSRLFSNVRSKKGLAYAVSGSVGVDYRRPGVTRLAAGTQNATTAAAIDALYEEIAALADAPATEEELRRAKAALLNSFIFRFDSPDKVLREAMWDLFYGLPAESLMRYRAGVEAVTVEDLARVGKTYIHKDRLALLVVGKASEFDRPLSSFGTVTTIDITIPPPPAPPAP